jgi:hypothetical protein
MTYFDWALVVVAIADVLAIVIMFSSLVQGKREDINNPLIFWIAAPLLLAGIALYFLDKFGLLSVISKWHP